MKVIIHAMPKRMWYVNGFLYERLIKSGFNKSDVIVDVDNAKKGCLNSYLDSFSLYGLKYEDENIWHLQDDIVPCRDFYKRALKYEDDCDGYTLNGFGCEAFYNEDTAGTPSKIEDMWYSFPCIRISGSNMILFTRWFLKHKNDKGIKEFADQNKFVDYFFKLFTFDNLDSRGRPYCVNISPCMVEHVDEYLGGSTISNGYRRKKPVKAVVFNDYKSIEEFKDYLYRVGKY